jgi:hypothetical protein
MKLTKTEWSRVGKRLEVCLLWVALSWMAHAQGFSTTTVQGTVYLANGHPGAGTLQVSWPSFTTAANQAVTAGRTMIAIGTDGYVSVNLAPNVSASPAGLYYTAIYSLSDGTTSTEYWVIPVAAQVSLGQVRAKVMPAAQAVQAVSKTYVDQSIQELTQSLLTASGGSLTGPLYLNGDPQIPTQAADKHYVDSQFSQAVPLSGGVMSGPLTAVKLGGVYQADQAQGSDFGSKLQSCINGLDATYGGTCDARNFTGNVSLPSDLSISTANVTVQFPCATIATNHQVIVAAGTRNVTFHGCAMRGASTASGSQGGTVFLYSGTGAMVQVGDPTYAMDTPGFHMDNAVINTTASSVSTAQGMVAYRTQELDLENLYFLGNSNQTGLTLDGTGNYTGGTFQDDEFGGFGTALNAIGHQAANSAATDWMNASTFVRLHINCPTSGGSPMSGTYGINLQQGDGNTFTGGDVEGCSTAVHLGANAQNNTIVGLRNENSTNQVVADAGSSYNNWMTGGTMFTGQLKDNGTRNSFLDTFHRSFNGMNGDWYGSQQDATLTNHYRIGIGTGNERGLLNRYQTDSGYRWTTGLSDATAGEQFYQVLDELNNVYRLSIGQYNNGQSGTNNQTVINAAGAGAVVLNGSANAGTGGVVFGSGGSNGATVATINSAGNAQFNGTLQVGGPSTFIGSTTIKNQADAEADAFLWAGATASQKESLIYKDWNGSSQWYMVKDASNNWALNSAPGGLDSFKAYQSTNSGDTYINASNAAGHIRLNYESGSGAETDIYSGSSAGLVAAFLNPTAIKLPGLASGTGHNCLQIDNSGYITNTGSSCGSGSLNGTVNAGTAGQVAYYTGNGTAIAGTSAVSVTAGGTGATTASAALANLGGQSALPGVVSDGATGVKVDGNVAAGTAITAPNIAGSAYASQFATGGTGTPSSPWTSASGTGGIQEAINSLPVTTGNAAARTVYISSGYYLITANILITTPVTLRGAGGDSVLYVSSSLGSTTDVINVTPTSSAEMKGITLEDFAIIPQSGTPGRYGINLDGSNNVIVDGLIRHVNIRQLGSNGVYVYSSGPSAWYGTPSHFTIEESAIFGGISCTTCGDNILVKHNLIGGTGTNTFDFVSGGTSFVLEGNLITLSGGTRFGGAIQATSLQIQNNEFETEPGFTGSNSSVLDLDGPVYAGSVSGNSFQVVNGITANGLRLNNTVGVTVEHNNFMRGATTSSDILATSTSAHNHIGVNYWVNGPPYTSMFNDSGSGNVFYPDYSAVTGYAGPLLGNNTAINAIDGSGAVHPLLKVDSSSYVYYYGNAGVRIVESIPGANYWFDGSANGQIFMATGTYTVGTQPSQVAQSASYAAFYNIALSQMLMSRTLPTVGSGFGTGAFVAAGNGTAVFTVNVGTGGTATSGVISLPTAAQGWGCTCADTSTTSATVFMTKQTASSTTSCTVGNFNTSGVAAAWASADYLSCKALAY